VTFFLSKKVTEALFFLRFSFDEAAEKVVAEAKKR